jgi:tetratricopeptide (TPR) repeat protein
VTEVLAGAPELMRRYEQATEEQKAVLHAAIDARRVGIQAVLSEQLLREAARGYLSTVHPGNTWFPPALDELTRPKRGTAPLIPVPNADYSQVLGFAVADYLLQHLTRRRRSVCLSGVTWQALAGHTHDPDDLIRLGDAARSRLLYNYAESAYRCLADAGDAYAADLLADLLAQQGRIREAIEVLRVHADAGDWNAGDRLAGLLAQQGRIREAIEVMLVRADGRYAPVLPSGLLAHKPHADEAVEILRVHADTGNEYAAALLADLLIQQGRIPEAIEVMLVHARGRHAAVLPSGLLFHQPHADKVVEILRVRADTGDEFAAALLADLLVQQGRVPRAVHQLTWAHFSHDGPADLLAEQGRIDELRALADAGDAYAANLLVGLLAKQGRVAEAIEILRAEVDAGTRDAAGRLITMLAEQGETAAADRMRRFGLNTDGSIADGNPGIRQSRPTAAS